MSTRSDRARRRAIKLRNQRIAFVTILVLLLTGGGYLAYSSFFAPDAQATPAAAGVTPPAGAASSAPAASSGMPDLSSLTTAGGGLDYRDEVVGTGEEAVPGKTATVHYTGWLRSNGQKFDSSLDRGQPFDFQLGAGQVIQGWEKGVAGMKVGGKRILVIPPELGYGASGAGGVIPPNAVLVFEIELLGVK